MASMLNAIRIVYPLSVPSQQGYPRPMVILTTLLALASPVEPDTLRTWRASCESLDAEACVALAEATVAGLATDMQQEGFQPFLWRRDQAEYWFKQACIAGDAVSCDHVDRMTRGQRDAYCMDGVPWAKSCMPFLSKTAGRR